MAEAYLETDYTALTLQDFAKVVREYAIFAAVTAEAADDDEGLE